nr:MAG TPA: hypothetical protein [Caudoviricetes sp.]
MYFLYKLSLKKITSCFNFITNYTICTKKSQELFYILYKMNYNVL